MSSRIPCPKCGYLNVPERRWCKKCKIELAEAYANSVPESAKLLTEVERSDILQKEISRYTRDGYRVVLQTETTAQLVKPKSFSVFIAILGLLFFVVGLIIYLLIYAAAKEESVYLSVDKYGRIQRS